MGRLFLRLCGALEHLAIALLVFLCRFWQVLLSPLVGCRCRFYPTCSQYAVESLKEHGLFRGLRYAALRLCRCHPRGKGGIDPVPAGRRVRKELGEG